MPTTYAHVFEAHKAAVRALEHAASMALAIPTAADVRAQLHRLAIEITTEETFDACRALGLALADMPSESPADITRKIEPQ